MTDHDSTPVEPGFACPWCGEREMDFLIWVEDDVVECHTCGCRYDPGPGLIWLEGDPARERKDRGMNRRHPIEYFSVDDEGALVRTRSSDSGHRYKHRCDRETLAKVALFFDGHRLAGGVLEQVIEAERVRWTRGAVAMAFLINRGIVERHGRISFSASGDCFLDAMTEYHALMEKGADPAAGV